MCNFKLLMTTPKKDPTVRKLTMRLRYLGRRCPERTSGLSMQVRAYNKARLVLKDDNNSIFDNQKEATKAAAIAWSLVTQETRTDFETQAFFERHQKRKALNAEIVDVKRRLKRRTDEIAEKKGLVGNRGLASDMLLTKEEEEQLEKIWSGTSFSVAFVAETRKIAERDPRPPDEKEQRLIVQQPFWKPPWMVQAAPGWISPVATLREYFAECGLRLGSDPGAPVMLFTYAMQQPLQLTCLKLQQAVNPPMPFHLGFSVCVAACTLYYQHEYWACEHEYIHEFQFDSVRLDDVYVLPSLTRSSYGSYVSNLSWMRLDEFAGQFPHNPRRERQAAADSERVRSTPKVSIRKHAGHEWIHEYWQKVRGADKKRVKSGDTHRAVCEPRDLTEAELRALDQTVAGLREAWCRRYHEEMKSLEYFDVQHIGTPWTWRHKGVASDKIRGVCLGPGPERFCRRWGIQAEFGNHTPYYTIGQAEALSYAWCHKMNYYYKIWLSSGEDPGFSFGDGYARAYAEPDRLVQEIATWVPGDAALARLGQLRRLAPRGAAKCLK